MSCRRSWLLLAILFVAWLPMAAFAQTCDAQSSTGINFGSITGTPTPTDDVTGTITVSCSGGTVGATVRACSYIGNGNPATNKTMASGANTLNYNLYSDTAGGTPYGSRTVGTPPSLVYTVTSSPTLLTFTVFGRIFSGQTVAAGTYTASLNTVALAVTPSSSACGNGPSTPLVAVNMQVIVGASCTISATNINFGTVNTLTGTLNSTGNLSVTCSSGAAYSIAMNAGTSTGNTIAARKMSVGGNTAGVVGYQLYRDSGPVNLWGDGSTGVVYSGTGSGGVQTIPVYAQVPAQTTPTAATYKDTVTATITF